MKFFFLLFLAIYSNTHSSVDGGIISDHGAAINLFIVSTCAFKPGFLGTFLFREGVLRFPYKADYIFCIMYAVLHNLPVPVIIFNNEYWQYLKDTVRCKWNYSEINCPVYSEH
jgi:hypothetical protein